jgi:ABC-type proline/glycine betaine transport system ATPase subunit
MADRIVVMNTGRIEQVGTPLGFYDQPANRFAAEFIGSPAINLVEGVVEMTGEARRLSVGSRASAWISPPKALQLREAASSPDFGQSIWRRLTRARSAGRCKSSNISAPRPSSTLTWQADRSAAEPAGVLRLSWARTFHSRLIPATSISSTPSQVSALNSGCVVRSLSQWLVSG